MPLTREERKLLHQKSKQPTFGSGKPDKSSGNEGDVAYRKIQGTGTVQYLKQDGDWVSMSSSGEAPKQRPISGGGTTRAIISGGSGVTDHSSLSGLGSDDHTQYVLVDGTRAITGDLSLGGGDGALTFTADNSSIKIPDNKSASLIIEEADTAYLTFITTNSGEKITLGKKLEAGSVEIEGSAFDIDGGTVDGITSLTVANNVDIGNFKLTSKALESSDLTDTRITFAGLNGLLTDSANLTFVTDTLTSTKIAAYTLTGKLTAGSSEIEGSAFDIDGGDISAVTISGGLTWNYAQDLNNQALTNVNIDSGAIDGTVIGANSQAAGDFTAIGSVSAGTIVGTTIDATTDFTIGTTVITDDQIQMSPTNGTFTISSTNSGSSTIATIDTTGSNGAHLLLDTQGDLIVSPNTQLIKFHDGSNYVFEFDTANVKFKMADDADTGDYFEISTAQHGATTITTIDDDATAADLTFDIDGNINFKQTSGTTRYTFNIDSTPELDVTGDFTIDGSGVINIDGDTGVVLKESGVEVIKVDTDRKILFNSYAQSLYQQYGFHNKIDKYHQTSGRGDMQQNYSILSIHGESTSFNTSYGS